MFSNRELEDVTRLFSLVLRPWLGAIDTTNTKTVAGRRRVPLQAPNSLWLRWHIFILPVLCQNKTAAAWQRSSCVRHAVENKLRGADRRVSARMRRGGFSRLWSVTSPLDDAKSDRTGHQNYRTPVFPLICFVVYPSSRFCMSCCMCRTHNPVTEDNFLPYVSIDSQSAQDVNTHGVLLSCDVRFMFPCEQLNIRRIKIQTCDDSTLAITLHGINGVCPPCWRRGLANRNCLS